MAKVLLKRGLSLDLEKEPLHDGLISITTDDGRIHMDYIDENKILKRKTLYSGKLTFGPHIYDGTEDVTVRIYEGELNN